MQERSYEGKKGSRTKKGLSKGGNRIGKTLDWRDTLIKEGFRTEEIQD